MTPMRVLLDSDIVSAILNRDPRVVDRARDYFNQHKRFSFSIFTKYEILRGLKARDANRKLGQFEQICRLNEILPLTDSIVERAAEIYANLRIAGTPINDADILIGATALEHGMSVATNNERHFTRIQGLQIENWLKG
jgi:tRNA(fMet)-specific endonuclease VapC